MTEEYLEKAGRGLLEGLQAQSQTLSHRVMMSSEDMASPATLHQLDNKIQRDGGAQTAFTSTGKLSAVPPPPKRYKLSDLRVFC